MNKLNKSLETKDGSKIYYKYRKQSKKYPVILFIHGWVLNHTSFERIRIYLEEKGYSTLTFDLRGHGKSISDNLSFDLVIEDINQILKKEKIKEVCLVGHSMGGMISQKFINKYPKKVKSMILINTSYKNPRKNLPINWRLLKYFLETAGKVLLDKKKRGYFSKSMVIILSNEYPKINLIIKKHIKNPLDKRKEYLDSSKFNNMRDIEIFFEGLKKTGVKNAERFYLDILKFDLEEEIKNIKVPCLIITGLYDFYCSFKSGEYMKKSIKNSNLFILNNSDHLSILQETEKINEIIYEFLKEKI